MRFRCDRDVLTEALTAALRATTGAGLPALSSVLLDLSGDRLAVTGTDLTTAVEWSGLVSGGAGQLGENSDGRVAVPGKLLADIVKQLPAGPVDVATQDVPSELVSVSAGRSSFELRTIPVDQFPTPRWVEDGSEWVVPAKELLGTLRRVVSSASTDSSRPILTGVQFDSVDGRLRVVATDSYRLSVETIGDAEVGDASALVPAEAVNDLVRLAEKASGDVTVRLGERAVSFQAGSVRVGATLIEGAYPQWGGLIPSGRTGRLVANREALIVVVRRVRQLARESTPVRFSLDPAEVVVTAVTQDVGRAREVLDDDASYSGDPLEVAFNPEYLLDALVACPGDVAWLDVIDGRQPAVVRPSDESFLALLMPVRVS